MSSEVWLPEGSLISGPANTSHCFSERQPHIAVDSVFSTCYDVISSIHSVRFSNGDVFTN